MRSIEEVLTRFKVVLGNLKSPLATFKTYGNLYAIFRAIASVVVEIETKLDRTTFTEANAIGEVLDAFANSYGLYRLQGSKGSGSALVKSSSPVTLKAGTVFQTSDGTQLITLSTYTLTNTSNVAVTLESLENKTISLDAGTVLVSNLYPQVKCVIGSYQDSKGEYLGGFYDGSEKESDQELRVRVLRIKNSNANKELVLQNKLLEIPGVSRLHLSNSNPVPGAVTLFINSKNRRVLDEVKNVTDTFKEPGILYSIKSIDYYSVDVVAEVSLSNLTDLNSIDTTIKLSLKAYLDSLDLTDSLYPQNLISIFLSIPGVRNVNLTLPSNPIVVTNKFFKLSNVKLSYSS